MACHLTYQALLGLWNFSATKYEFVKDLGCPNGIAACGPKKSCHWLWSGVKRVREMGHLARVNVMAVRLLSCAQW